MEESKAGRKIGERRKEGKEGRAREQEGVEMDHIAQEQLLDYMYH